MVDDDVLSSFEEACARADAEASRKVGNGSNPTLISQCAADITPEPVEWLWPGRVAIGKQTLIAGEPGLGKSQIAIAMAAAVTTGGDWPCGEGHAPLGNVIVLQAEDGLADTVVPRLIAAGADLERVRLITAVVDPNGRRGLNLQGDLTTLEEEIARVGDVRLVIIDPISSYLGPKVDSHVNAAVRAVLEPVGEMADRLRLAIVSNTHFTKGGGIKAINRFIGSIAFVAAARTAFVVTNDAEDEDRRLFLPVKNNLAPRGKGLAFRLEQRLVGDAGKGIVASSVAWESEPTTISADQALQAADEQAGGRSVAAEAEQLLREILADGPVPAADVKREALNAGLSWPTVRRAQARLGIQPTRIAESGDGLGGRGRWYWSLPAQPAPKVLNKSLRCSSQGKSTLGEDEHLRTPAPSAKRPPDHDLDVPESLRRHPCDHCGGGDGITRNYNAPGDPDGVWLHEQCEAPWFDAESRSARRAT